MTSMVAVIGSGAAGLACIYTLLPLGYSVDIFELDDRGGGLSLSLAVLGHRADLGPHYFLSPNPLVHDFWHTAKCPIVVISTHAMA